MGFWMMSFAEFSGGVGARRIKITKGSPVQIVGLPVPTEDALNEELGFALGIYRLFRMIFRNGDRIRGSVDRTARRENKMVDSGVEERT